MPPAAGAVVVEEDRLLLEGRQAGTRFELSLAYPELTQIHIGRGPDERLNGHPTVVITRRDGPCVHIQPFGAGLLHELTGLLAALAAQHADEAEQVTVVVPLRRGSLERVKELVVEGPPFDPAALGLRRHQVFLTPTEAIFVLEGTHARETFERALREPSFWRAGLAWRSSIAGRPHVADAPPTDAELVYSWAANGEHA